MEISRKLSRLLSEKKQQSKSLDRKLATSCQQFFNQSIEFRPASGPDSHLENLKSLYKPLNKIIPEPASTNMESEQSTESSKNLTNSQSSDLIPAPRKVLFNSDNLDMEWKRVRSIGAGLSNMGNTCFLNSVLQCLAYTPPLVNYLLSGEHKQNCCVSGFCTICEFQKHCSQVHLASHGCVKPTVIVHSLRAIAKHFRLGRQEDAHEFLRYFIDGMQKSCLHGYPAKLDPHSKATTVVHQIFGGYHRSQVKCLECMKTSDTYDPLLDVSLDIKNCNSLLKALHKSIKPDLLEGDNCYACPYCKKMTKAQKRFTIQRLPRVLTLQLKRFDFNSMFGGKVNKSVGYPEHIDMRPFMSCTQGPSEWYTLYAVLVHFGFSCHSGHYYCYVRNSNGSWYCMNDSQVTQVSLNTVLQQEAYLLFYIRDEGYAPNTKQQGMKSDPNFLSSAKKQSLGLGKTGTPLVQRKPTGVVPPSPKIIPAGKEKPHLSVTSKRTQEFSIPLRKTPVPIVTNKATSTAARTEITPTNVPSPIKVKEKKPVFIPRQIKAVGKVKKSRPEKEKLILSPSLSTLLEENEDSKEGEEDVTTNAKSIPLASSIQPLPSSRITPEPVKTTPPLDQPIRLIGPLLPPTHGQKPEDEASASLLVALVSPQCHSGSLLGSSSKPVALVRPSPHLTPDDVKQEPKMATVETSVKGQELAKDTAPPSPRPSPDHTVTPSLKHPSPPPQSSPQVDSTTSGDVAASPEAVPYGPDLSSNHVTSTLEQNTPSPKHGIKFKLAPLIHLKKHKKNKIYRKSSHFEADDGGQRSNSDEETPVKVSSAKSEHAESGHKKTSSSHHKERPRSRGSHDREHKHHHRKHSVSSSPSGRPKEVSGHHETGKRKHGKHRDSRSKSPRSHSRRSRSRTPRERRHFHSFPGEHVHRHRHRSHGSHSSERVKHRSRTRSRSPNHKKFKVHVRESSGERVKESPARHDSAAKANRLKAKRKKHHESESPESKRHKSDSSAETHKPAKHAAEIVWDGPRKGSSGGGLAKWDGSKGSDVLQQLTSRDRGVRSWEGGESSLVGGASREERRRRDSWDEELDKGKVKKVKKKVRDDFGFSNRFQEFHNRRSSGGSSPHCHKPHSHHKAHDHKRHRRH